jgi:hypothetical protein
LNELLADMGASYGEVFRSVDCDPQFGVELLSQGDMFAAEPSGRVIRADCMPKAESHRIQRWQVLIAGAGTLGETELYGRSIIADGRLAGKFVGPHALALTFNDPQAPESLYTYSFLGTTAGIQCIRAASYGTKVLSLRLDKIRNLPIPIGPTRVVEHVAELVRATVHDRELYAEEMKLARKPIEDLPEYREALAMCTNQVARCLIWTERLTTLSAWNYASTGGALAYLRRQWAGRLEDAVEPEGLYNGLRFARVPSKKPYGLDFLSQRDVFLIRPIPRRIVHPGLDNRMLFVPDCAILLGSHGQLTEGSLFGRAESAACGAAGSAITQDILRIIPKQDYWQHLFVFLSTAIGMSLLRSTAVGTSVPTMHIGLLRQLPIPQLDSRIAKSVNLHASRAIAARVRSNKAEAEAVRIIEEEVLAEWLS